MLWMWCLKSLNINTSVLCSNLKNNNDNIEYENRFSLSIPFSIPSHLFSVTPCIYPETHLHIYYALSFALSRNTHTLIFVCLLKGLLTILIHWSRANVQKKNRGKTKSHSQITGINQHEETESRKRREPLGTEQQTRCHQSHLWWDLRTAVWENVCVFEEGRGRLWSLTSAASSSGTLQYESVSVFVH